MSRHTKCCGGDHHHDVSPEAGVEYSLYSKIIMDDVSCLNEVVQNSGKTIFKPWEERLDQANFVESDSDEELLFNIPFAGNVKLKGIVIIGLDDDSHPSKVRLFKNRPGMTFDDATVVADQEFALHVDVDGSLEYQTKMVTFNNVHHLSMHFPSNFGAERTKIFYIGMRGEFTEAHRHGVTICTYEVRPNLMDHKNPLPENTPHLI